MSGKQIDSMRKNGVLNRPIHPSRETSSSPIEVKQSSPDSLSQCSSQSSAGSAKSLPVTIPAQEQLGFLFTRQTSDPGLVGCSSPSEDNSPTQHRKGFSHDSLVPSSELPIMATEVVSATNHSGPGCSEISELLSSHPHTSGLLQQSRPLILQHPSHGSIDEGSNGTNYINWLCELYPSVLGSPSSKEKLSSYHETTPPLPPSSSHSPDPTHISSKSYTQDHVDTVFSSQEKYVVTLGAPISIAQRMGEDTLTYLNKGQFYSLFCKANSGCPDLVKSVVYLTFFDEPDNRVEQSNWQYWYSQQANPNQKAFDIDRKACENIQGKPVDLAYNVASFIWRPKLGSKLVLRINCLSTEFSSQKGVKGYPLHVVVDTYEDLENEATEPVHRAYCRVKIFRDKGAERKNKDETRNLDRRIQKVMRQRPGTGVPLDSDIPTSVFHPPTRETALNPTSTFGPKPFLFVPEQVRRPRHSFVPRKEGSPSPSFPVSHHDTSLFLASLKERETKRTIGNILSQAKEDLNHLEVGAPAKKAALVPDRPVITVYVRKEEEKVYNALLLDCLTVHDFKLQIARTYDVPPEMIKNVFKRTKKGLLVHFNAEMISRLEDESDFIIDLPFDNQKGVFDLHIRY